MSRGSNCNPCSLATKAATAPDADKAAVLHTVSSHGHLHGFTTGNTFVGKMEEAALNTPVVVRDEARCKDLEALDERVIKLGTTGASGILFNQIKSSLIWFEQSAIPVAHLSLAVKTKSSLLAELVISRNTQRLKEHPLSEAALRNSYLNFGAMREEKSPNEGALRKKWGGKLSELYDRCHGLGSRNEDAEKGFLSLTVDGNLEGVVACGSSTVNVSYRQADVRSDGEVTRSLQSLCLSFSEENFDTVEKWKQELDFKPVDRLQMKAHRHSLRYFQVGYRKSVCFISVGGYLPRNEIKKALSAPPESDSASSGNISANRYACLEGLVHDKLVTGGQLVDIATSTLHAANEEVKRGQGAMAIGKNLIFSPVLRGFCDAGKGAKGALDTLQGRIQTCSVETAVMERVYAIYLLFSKVLSSSYQMAINDPNVHGVAVTGMFDPVVKAMWTDSSGSYTDSEGYGSHPYDAVVDTFGDLLVFLLEAEVKGSTGGLPESFLEASKLPRQKQSRRKAALFRLRLTLLTASFYCSNGVATADGVYKVLSLDSLLQKEVELVGCLKRGDVPYLIWHADGGQCQVAVLRDEFAQNVVDKEYRWWSSPSINSVSQCLIKVAQLIFTTKQVNIDEFLSNTSVMRMVVGRVEERLGSVKKGSPLESILSVLLPSLSSKPYQKLPTKTAAETTFKDLKRRANPATSNLFPNSAMNPASSSDLAQNAFNSSFASRMTVRAAELEELDYRTDLMQDFYRIVAGKPPSPTNAYKALHQTTCTVELEISHDRSVYVSITDASLAIRALRMILSRFTIFAKEDFKPSLASTAAGKLGRVLASVAMGTTELESDIVNDIVQMSAELSPSLKLFGDEPEADPMQPKKRRGRPRKLLQPATPIPSNPTLQPGPNKADPVQPKKQRGRPSNRPTAVGPEKAFAKHFLRMEEFKISSTISQRAVSAGGSGGAGVAGGSGGAADGGGGGGAADGGGGGGAGDGGGGGVDNVRLLPKSKGILER
ncbi:hypothetical protein HDV05_008017 [Chytridiales sp. JEL 0842]|nr:hypothetical protein HDV05_008017 [Chytridiales sp. JEL 0842]